MNAIKKILVPVDFSEHSENALKAAISLALRNGAKLDLLHTLHIPVAYADVPVLAAETMVKEMQEETEKKFQQLKETTAGLSNVIGEAKTETGFAADVILELCNEGNYDLLVMGTKGATGLKEIFVGSNTAEVIGKSPIPVLAVPLEGKLETIHSLMVAYDGVTFPTDKSAEVLKDFADAFGSIVHLVHVFKPGLSIEEAKARGKQFFEDRNISLRYENVFASDVDLNETLLDFAKSKEYHLICTIHKTQNWLVRLFQTSISKKLAYHPEIPLLVLQSEN